MWELSDFDCFTICALKSGKYPYKEFSMTKKNKQTQKTENFWKHLTTREDKASKNFIAQNPFQESILIFLEVMFLSISL